MDLNEFQEFNKINNPSYKAAIDKNLMFKPVLPSPDEIYYKDFHFLDEPLIKRKHVGINIQNKET